MIGVFNKASLLSLLRKHPNWNEDTLSVKFDVSAVRKLDVDVVRSKARALLLAAHDSVEGCRYDDCYWQIRLSSFCRSGLTTRLFIRPTV